MERAFHASLFDENYRRVRYEGLPPYETCIQLRASSYIFKTHHIVTTATE